MTQNEVNGQLDAKVEDFKNEGEAKKEKREPSLAYRGDIDGLRAICYFRLSDHHHITKIKHQRNILNFKILCKKSQENITHPIHIDCSIYDHNNDLPR